MPVDANFTSEHPVGDLPLHPRLLQRLQQMCIKFLTDIQAAAFPAIMSDADVLMKSHTGSGKTLAYTIPLVQRMAQDWAATPFTRKGGTRCLVVVPTRELVVQCLEVISNVARPFPHFVPGGIMGGEQRHKEKARLRQGVVTLVCTPGRLVDHLRSTKSFVLSAVQYVVYDEADRILDLGFEKDITFLLAHLQQQGAKVHKAILASATLDLRVQRLAHVTLQSPVLVGYDAAPSGPPPPGVEPSGGNRIHANQELDTDVTLPPELRQHYVICPCRWRLSTLTGFLRMKLDAMQPNKVIVFLSNVDSVEFHYALLSNARVAGAPQALTAEERQERAERRLRAAEARRKRKKARLQAARRIQQQLEGGEEGDGGDAPDAVPKEEEEDEEVPEALAGGAQAKAEGPLLVPYNLFRLHGNVDQLERVSVYKAFSQCKRGVLLCTDVAARGVDFPGVTWIVQYDTPGEERNYIHRIGRTARIGHVGNSLLFLMPHEAKYTRCLRRHKLFPEQMKSEVVMFHMAQALGTPDITSAAPVMHAALCACVRANPAIQRLARLGFQAFVRAYATHPKRLKTIFHPKELHLGHVAASFALPAKPSEVDSRELRRVKQQGRKAVAKEALHGKKAVLKKATEEYVPAVLRKEEKARKDKAQAAKQKETAKKKRPIHLSPTSEFEANLVLPPKRRRIR